MGWEDPLCTTLIISFMVILRHLYTSHYWINLSPKNILGFFFSICLYFYPIWSKSQDFCDSDVWVSKPSWDSMCKQTKQNKVNWTILMLYIILNSCSTQQNKNTKQNTRHCKIRIFFALKDHSPHFCNKNDCNAKITSSHLEQYIQTLKEYVNKYISKLTVASSPYISKLLNDFFL